MKKELDFIISQNLKKLRTERGLTQSDIGKMLGVTMQMIQKIESHKNALSAASLKIIANNFGVTVDSFFGVEPNTAIITIKSGRMTQTFANFPEVIQKSILESYCSVANAITEHLKVSI